MSVHTGPCPPLSIVSSRFQRTCRGAVTPVLLCAFAVLLLSPMASPASEEEPGNVPPAGFTALWNGRDLAGWWGAGTEDPRKISSLEPGKFQKKHDESLDDIRRHWSVQRGELVNDGHGLFLTTDKEYGDFELLIEYKTVPLADSGIYLRGCPQVQIWDSTEKAKFALGADKGSGGLWNNRPGASGKDPLVKADKPFGEWNRFQIAMIGSRVWVRLNDRVTVDGAVLENYFNRNMPVPPRGPIQLQTHGGEIRWRNVFIREIGSDEAVARLRGADPKAFRRVFNGIDFTGWAGPTDCCAVADSALVRQAHQGGTIYTRDDPVMFRNIAIAPIQ